MCYSRDAPSPSFFFLIPWPADPRRIGQFFPLADVLSSTIINGDFHLPPPLLHQCFTRYPFPTSSSSIRQFEPQKVRESRPRQSSTISPLSSHRLLFLSLHSSPSSLQRLQESISVWKGLSLACWIRTPCFLCSNVVYILISIFVLVKISLIFIFRCFHCWKNSTNAFCFCAATEAK